MLTLRAAQHPLAAVTLLFAAAYSSVCVHRRDVSPICDRSWPLHNTSGTIRQALIYDYVKSVVGCPDGDPGGHLHPRQSNTVGIWDDWSDEVRQYATLYPAVQADTARL